MYTLTAPRALIGVVMFDMRIHPPVTPARASTRTDPPSCLHNAAPSHIVVLGLANFSSFTQRCMQDVRLGCLLVSKADISESNPTTLHCTALGFLRFDHQA